MIITETILKSIFSQLPDYKGYPIRYEWGDQPDLILYLKTISGNKYPLIWLVNGDQTVDRYGNKTTRKCRLILAKDSQHVTNRNPKVWETEFVDCLNPLLENIYKALESSGATTILSIDNERREANYTEEDLLKATDFWNVIILDITLRFTDNCIKKIKF
jgi:hypothetical protein